jgi:hypothetical protein
MSEEHTKGRHPDYKLKLMDKVSKEKSKVGAAWENEDGSITIKLDLGVCLNSFDLQDCHLCLFTNDWIGEKK